MVVTEGCDTSFLRKIQSLVAQFWLDILNKFRMFGLNRMNVMILSSCSRISFIS